MRQLFRKHTLPSTKLVHQNTGHSDIFNTYFRTWDTRWKQTYKAFRYLHMLNEIAIAHVWTRNVRIVRRVKSGRPEPDELTTRNLGMGKFDAPWTYDRNWSRWIESIRARFYPKPLALLLVVGLQMWGKRTWQNTKPAFQRSYYIWVEDTRISY